MDFNMIDWNSLWQEASGRANCDQKSQKDQWDQRAESFSQRINRVENSQEGLFSRPDASCHSEFQSIMLKSIFSLHNLSCYLLISR